MSHLETKLFAIYQTTGYTEPEWREIMEHVVAKLEVFLGQPVLTSGMRSDARGFDGDVASPAPFAGRLELSWFGRIGVDGFPEATVLQAFIFFRGAGKRLVAIAGEAYLWLEYKELVAGQFGWTALKWDQDVFGEFEQWQ